MSLTTQPRRRMKHPYQLIHRADGSIEVVVCHRNGCSRFFGNSERETTDRAKSYEASLRRSNEQLY